jgi:hypothetical protein
MIINHVQAVMKQLIAYCKKNNVNVNLATTEVLNRWNVLVLIINKDF